MSKGSDLAERVRRGRAGGLLTAVSILAAVSVVGGTALRIGAANLHQAEHERLRSRAELVTSTAEGHAAGQRADPIVTTVNALPFSPGNAAVNQMLLSTVAASGDFDPTSLVALLDGTGTVQAAEPAGSRVTPDQLGPGFAEALAGRPASTPAFTVDGAVVTGELVPVRQAGTPWAVVAVLRPTRTTSLQAMVKELGALDGQPGGLTVVDPHGVVVQSWDPDRIGTTGLPGAVVRDLPIDGTRHWTTGESDDEVVHVGRRQPSGYAVLFEERASALFADLATAQRHRDRTTVAVLVVLTLALAGFQLARQRAARRSEARVRRLLENGRNLILVTGGRGELRFVSPSIGRRLGHDPDLQVGRLLVDLAHPDDRGRLAAHLRDPAAGALMDVRLRHRSGGYRWFDVTAEDCRGNDEIGGVLLTCREVDERKQLQDELAYQATHDRLTGATNRTQLTERLDELLDRRPRRPFALFYVDLDHFKPVNDAHGHDAGDAVLVAVTERMRRAAGPGALVCRLGGDEFCIVVPALGADDVEARTTALLDAVRRPVAWGVNLLRVDASIGVLPVPAEAPVASADSLVREADRAMYEAKRAGRGRYLVAAPDGAVTATGTRRERPAAPAAAPAVEAPPRSPEPGAPGPAAPRPHRRAHLVPLLAATAVVVIVAGFGQVQAVRARQAAEATRLAGAVDLSARFAEFYSRAMDIRGYVRTLDGQIPWALDGGPGDQAIVDLMGASTGSTTDSPVGLSRPDGELLTAYPAGGRPPVGPSSPAWRTALDGRTGIDPAVVADGLIHTYLLLPVVQEGRVAAVLSVAVPTRSPSIRRNLVVGPTSPFGNYALVTADGVVFMAWDWARVGERVADPADLAQLGATGSRPISHPRGDVAVAARIPSWSSTSEVYVVFAEPPAAFYEDLRSGEDARAATLAVVVLLAVAGLAVVNHRREGDARRRERRLDALLQAADDLIVVVDPAGRTEFVSAAIGSLLGHRREDWIGRALIELVHPDDAAKVADALDSARRGLPATRRDIRLREHDGTDRWFDLEADALRAGSGAAARVLVTGHDVTHRRAIAQQLAHQAAHDRLTGLPNRASFAALLDAQVEGERPFAVLFIDLDHFKPVNDAFGHDVGDAVLREVADRLRTTVRTAAGRGTRDGVCRLGGDEFAVVLLDVVGDQTQVVAERILAAVREPVEVAGTAIRIDATIGIAFSDAGGSPVETVRNADAAMYRAKQGGRGRYAVHAD